MKIKTEYIFLTETKNPYKKATTNKDQTVNKKTKSFQKLPNKNIFDNDSYFINTNSSENNITPQSSFETRESDRDFSYNESSGSLYTVLDPKDKLSENFKNPTALSFYYEESGRNGNISTILNKKEDIFNSQIDFENNKNNKESISKKQPKYLKFVLLFFCFFLFIIFIIKKGKKHNVQK